MGLFGSSSKEANEEKESVDTELRLKMESLQAELASAQDRLKESETILAELQSKVDEYESRERQVAEVMISAQISAQKTEAEARAMSEKLLQETDEELRRKNKELELLRIKAQLFKQEMNERLNQYKSSLEGAMEVSDDMAFTPTLVTKDKNEKKII